ncbi:MAG: Zn-ribbon domain-containing OB-fold protein [Acidobacteriota bacterium]
MPAPGFTCSCGRVFLSAAASPACPSCGRRDAVAETTLSGRGTIYSFSRVHVPTPRFQDKAPYVLALVDLAEGARVTCQIETGDPSSLAVGSPVAFAGMTAGVPIFQPA